MTTSIDDFPGSDTQKLSSALASGAKLVLIPRSITVTAGQTVPTGVVLAGDGQPIISKAFNGDLFNLEAYSRVENLSLYGDGANYTGRGFVVSAGNGQQIANCSVNDMDGYCLEVADDDVGVQLLISGGNWCRRHPALPAIKFPASDSPSVGGRSIQNVWCGGGVLVDLSGSNITDILCCNTTGIIFGSNTRLATVQGCRVASATLTVDGQNNSLIGCATGGDIVVASTAQNTKLIGNQGANLTIQTGAVLTQLGQNGFSGTVTDNASSTLALQRGLPLHLFGPSGQSSLIMDGPGNYSGAELRTNGVLRARIMQQANGDIFFDRQGTLYIRDMSGNVMAAI